MRLLIAVAIMAIGNTTTCSGDTTDFDKRVLVTRSNVESLQIDVSFHDGAELFTVEMPYAPAGMLFDNAILAFSNERQDLKIPVAVKKNDEELFIAFWATRSFLTSCELTIRYHRKDEIEGRVYVLPIKDLIPQER